MRHDGSGGIRKESNATVSEQEVSAPGVHAPEMKGVALVSGVPGSKFVRARQATDSVHGNIALAHAEDHVRRPVLRLPFAGVPPAQNAIRTRGPLANKQRIACSIRDVGESDLGVKKKHSILPQLVGPFNAEIVGESE